ncbi:MAG: CAP domain-containing protein [Hyphomicrobiales bacterium]
MNCVYKITRQVLLVLSLLFFISSNITSCKKEETKESIKPEVVSLASFTESMTLVNAARTSGYKFSDDKYFTAVKELKWNAVLAKAAQKHAQDMQDKNYFSHTGKDGSKPWDRVVREGYTYSYCGENIAEGYDSEKAVINGWLHSEGHCANIMNDKFTEIGMGRSSDGKYWVQVFAAPQ